MVAPKWTILHEHRFQLHKALRKQHAVPNQPKVLSANAVMDIFLTQEAETIDLLNRECKNAEGNTDGELVGLGPVGHVSGVGGSVGFVGPVGLVGLVVESRWY